MIEKLYEKYLIECSNNSILEAVAFELFKEKICDKLSDMKSIAIDNNHATFLLIINISQTNSSGTLFYAVRSC